MPSKPLSCNQYVARGIRRYGLRDVAAAVEMATELAQPVPQVAPHRQRKATAKMTLPPVAAAGGTPPSKTDSTSA